MRERLGVEPKKPLYRGAVKQRDKSHLRDLPAVFDHRTYVSASVPET
jgi:hypothetical protein